MYYPHPPVNDSKINPGVDYSASFIEQLTTCFAVIFT